MTSSGQKPATFLLVAQRLNHLRFRVLLKLCVIILYFLWRNGVAKNIIVSAFISGPYKYLFISESDYRKWPKKPRLVKYNSVIIHIHCGYRNKQQIIFAICSVVIFIVKV
jgi:hypothetical protein